MRRNDPRGCHDKNGARRTRPPGPVALPLPACGASDDDSSPSSSTGSSSAAPAVDLNTSPMNAHDTKALDRLVQGVYTAEVKALYPALWAGIWHPERGAYDRKMVSDGPIGCASADWHVRTLASACFGMVDVGRDRQTCGRAVQAVLRETLRC